MIYGEVLKKNLFGDTEAYLVFDDTVINNMLGYDIELTRRQYSGIGSSSCSWVLE